MSNAQQVQNVIVATQIEHDVRIDILPTYFPENFLEVENTIYTVTDRICDAYKGGFWEFYALSNGGFYMAPTINKPCAISIPFGNDYTGEVSNDALGIITCLYAFCFLAQNNELMAERYHQLRDFAYEHSESDKIWWAID